MKKSVGLFLLMLLSLSLKAPSSEYLIDTMAYHNYYSEREFLLFAHQLAYIESRDDHTAINSIGAIGLYQFMPSTLMKLGYAHVTPKTFKHDPSIFDRNEQYKALNELISLNTIDLIPYYGFIGDTISGIKITKSGMLGGMHLGGIGAVSLFLLSDGIIDKTDMNGTKISHYIKTFGIYEF